MQILMNENSINSITNRGRYPDAVVKNLQLWVKKPGNMYWILRFKIDGDRKDMSLGACPQYPINLSLDSSPITRLGIKNKSRSSFFISVLIFILSEFIEYDNNYNKKTHVCEKVTS